MSEERTINVELLERVKAHILEEPRRFDMHTFLEDAGEWLREARPPCGTVACIAGWAAVLTDGKNAAAAEDYDVEERAAELLGIDDSAADHLFFTSFWPRQFEAAYKRAKGRDERAQVAARRIDHFIATNGAE